MTIAAQPPVLAAQQPQVVQQPPQVQQQRRSLTLTREQMLEAQEMFRTANKVTRPEKALILGFMAGSRDNPCPHLGKILSVYSKCLKSGFVQNPDKWMFRIQIKSDQTLAPDA